MDELQINTKLSRDDKFPGTVMCVAFFGVTDNRTIQELKCENVLFRKGESSTLISTLKVVVGGGVSNILSTPFTYKS